MKKLFEENRKWKDYKSNCQAGIVQEKSRELILDGKVKVNGEICDVLGTK